MLVQVHQHEATGVFGLDRAQQSPHGGLGEVAALRRSPGDDQRGARLLGHPSLDQVQCGAGLVVGAGDDVGRAGVELQHRHVMVGIVGDTGHGYPAGGVQRVPGVSGSRSGRRAQHQRSDGRDRQTGPVGEEQRESRSGAGDPHPGRGGAHREHRDVGPGEGDSGRALAGAVGQPDPVQGRVEQGRVQSEPGDVDLVGQPDLGEDGDVVAVGPAPDRAQALERRAVVVADVGEPRVEAVEVDGLGALGRPGLQGVPGRDGVAGEETAGVPGPVAVLVESRVDADLTAAVRGGNTDGDLELEDVLGLQDERCLEGQFLHEPAARPFPGVQRQVDERGPRQQHGAEDGVVGQPGVRTEGQAARHDQAVPLGQGDGGAEQGVAAVLDAHAGEVPGGAAGEPEPAVLEGVGGQADGVGPGPVEERGPVDGGSPHVQVRQGRHGGARLVAVPAQRGHERQVGAGEAAGAERAEHPVRPQLQEGGDALLGEVGHPVGEPHRLADVADPVLGGPHLVGDRTSGQVGDEGDPGAVVGQGVRDGTELVEHVVHAR